MDAKKSFLSLILRSYKDHNINNAIILMQAINLPFLSGVRTPEFWSISMKVKTKDRFENREE